MGPYVAQILTAIVGSMAMMDAGMALGWSTPILPKLLRPQNEKDDEEEITITAVEGSWLASIMLMASILGPFLLKCVVDRIGRRWSLNGIVIIMFISWIIVGLAKDIALLYVGRFIGGLALGAAFPVTAMYIGEIADDQIRGGLSSMLTLALMTGQLLCFSVGPWTSRLILSVVSVVPLVIFLVAFPWLPESPYFWLMKGNRERASASLIRLRQRSDVTEELRSLEILVNEEQKNRSGFEVMTLFRSRGNRRAFLIALGLLTFQQTSGAHAISAYAGLVFENSGLTGWTNWSTIILGLSGFVTGLSVLGVIDAAGRRPILMVSAFLSAVFLILEAVFFHLQYSGYDTSAYSWVPLLGLVGFQCSVFPGLGGIPWIMIGELFPTNVKAFAAISLGTYGSTLGFVVTRLYQPVESAFGVHWVYYGFAVLTLAGCVFIYFVVPETKKRSFDDIQRLLNTGSFEKLEVKTKRSDSQCKEVPAMVNKSFE